MVGAAASDKTVAIEVVFALPDQQIVVALQVEQGTTAATAVQRSGLQARFSDFDFANAALGVWNKVVARDYLLKDGDRVEVYRPLPMDPREARRILAAAGKSMGKTASAN